MTLSLFSSHARWVFFLSRERTFFSHSGWGLVNSHCLSAILLEFNGIYLVFSYSHDGFGFYRKIASITLTEEEGEVIIVGVTQRERMLEECSLNLLGRFLTTWAFNQRAAKALLRSVWRMGSDLWIVDVGDDLFQFKFTMESQLKWVLANGTWSFEDHPLALRRWERGMTDISVRFTSMSMWVQV